MTSGVPQGLFLGPLLFLLYINDLPDLWTSMSKFYADDSKTIGMEVDTNESVQKVQADLGSARDWVDDCLMQLNDGKCAVVHVRKHNPNTTYTICKPDGTRKELQRWTKAP